ncbi:MAG TPA: nuclear transport factor 2 family protein [Vicinamibacterales bacterium]|nr:nuclear transport factor 2 family protein [Vicinamibacterales bacterium]
MQRLRLFLACAAVLTIAAAPGVWSRTQAAQDRDAVTRAGLDYVEGVYQVQPERIQRSVHPSLVKRGFHQKDPGAPYVEMFMNYDQLVNLARNWNREGKRDTSIKKVEVLDLLDQTAVVKVTASWGVDHMLLGKYDGAWKISLIQWQSPPPARQM